LLLFARAIIALVLALAGERLVLLLRRRRFFVGVVIQNDDTLAYM
jgi:hypothetical protein